MIDVYELFEFLKHLGYEMWKVMKIGNINELNCKGINKNIDREFLEFSWEGTGMKIYVKVDPTVKVEGPLKLEFYNETSKELLTVTSKLGLLRAKL